MTAEEKKNLQEYIERMMEHLRDVISQSYVYLPDIRKNGPFEYQNMVNKNFHAEMTWFRQWLSEYGQTKP